MIDHKEIAIPESCHELLATHHIGMMSTHRHRDGLISTNPVGYVWNGQCLRVSTLKNRLKYKNLLADSRITLCIVDHQDVTSYVELRGYATIEDDPDRSFFRLQFREGNRIMRGVLDEEPPENLDPADAERVIITLHPQQVSQPTLYGGRLSK